ncbi:MAG TPA: hypothetical protein VLI40_02095 [Gemmatimonadaceae bacterium]|nr:hypothetical protein [Gemmatimonadaceae bacterium]
MASTVISMRLAPTQVQSLRRVARRWGKTASETSARLVEEALRMEEFAHIEFRDTASGRQAFIKGTRLSVWMLIAIANQYGADVAKSADHLRWAPERVQAGLNYYAAFRDEIDPVLQENEGYTFEQVGRRLPGVEEFSAGLHPISATKAVAEPAVARRSHPRRK